MSKRESELFEVIVDYIDPAKPSDTYIATGYSSKDHPKYYQVSLGAGSFALIPYESATCILVRPYKEEK